MEPQIEVFSLQEDGAWMLRRYGGLESMMEIPALGVKISLREIYDGVEFE